MGLYGHSMRVEAPRWACVCLSSLGTLSSQSVTWKFLPVQVCGFHSVLLMCLCVDGHHNLGLCPPERVKCGSVDLLGGFAVF